MSYADLRKKFGLEEEDEEVTREEKAKRYNELRNSSGLSYDQVDDNYINTFISDSNSFFSSAQGDYEKVGWSNAASTYESRYKTWQNLNGRAASISNWLSTNKSKLNKETYNNLSSALKSYYIDSAQSMTYFKRAQDTMSQYKTEADYNKAVKENEERTAKLNYDTTAGAAELRQMQDLYDKALAIEPWYISYSTNPEAWSNEDPQVKSNLAIYNEIKQKYGSLAALKKTLSDKKDYLNSAAELQRAAKWQGAGDETSEYYDPDFAKYAAEGAAIKNPSPKDAEGWLQIGKLRFGDEEVGNIVTYSRDNYTEMAMAGNSGKGDLRYIHMTDSEVDTYNYLLAKYGKKEAKKYLDALDDVLNYRQGKQTADLITGIDIPVVEEAAELMYGLGAGVDQFVGGMKQFFSEDALPVSATQYASSEIANSQDGLMKYAYSAATTVGNMAPSILVSSLTGMPLAGAATMGVSASGNAYGEALRAGYSKGEARTYSLLVGASEGTLQYLLGGIGELGGMSSKMMGKVAAIDSSLLRISAKLGISIGSEILEEELQLWLEPAFKSIIMGEDYDAPTIDAMIETAIVTALSTGALEAGGTIAQDKAESRQLIDTGKSVMDVDGGVQELLNLASEMSGASAENIQKSLTKQSGKVSQNMEAGKTTDKAARQVGKLYGTVQSAATSQNQADIVKSLTRGENGISQKDATAIAEAMVAQSYGQDLSRKQNRILQAYNGNERVRNAEQNIVANEKSTMGQRSQRLADLNGKVSAGVFEKAVDHVMKAKAVEETFTPKGTYDVSKEAKAIRTDTNEEIDIKGIYSINDGEMKLELADGNTIDTKDVSFASEGDALVYEAVANLGDRINAETANKLVAQYKGGDAVVFASGITQAYSYGYWGINKSELMGDNSMAAVLTKEQRNAAYQLGEQYRPVKDQADKAMARLAGKPGEKGVYYRDKNGNAVDIRTYMEQSGKTLTPVRKTAIEAMEKLSAAMGVRFNVYETWQENGVTYYLNENGVKTKGNPNGFYDTKTGEIYIDLNAGSDFQGTMLFTAAHELTHFLRQWSPEHFTKIAKIVFDSAGMKGRVSDLAAKQQAKAKANGRDIPFDEALEEVVADGMETILKDGKVLEFMAEVKQQDQTAWEKIKEWFKNFAESLKKLVSAYSGFTADSTEGQLVADAKDILNQIEQVFAEGALVAGENYQQSLTPGKEGTIANENGEPVAHSTADGTVQLSLRTYEEGGRDAFRNYLQKCVTSKKLTKAEMTEMLDGIEEIYNTCKEFKDKYAPFGTWSDAAVVRDTYGKPVFSVVTPNGDYKMNLDFSLVCKKRRALDAVFNEMSKRGIIDDFELGQKSVVKINEIIRKHGFETACALCFVDAKRFRQASMADSFTSLYNELVRSLVPESQQSSIGSFNFAGYDTIQKVENGIDTWDNSKLDFSHIDHVMKTYGDGTVEYKAAKYIKTHPEGRKLLLRGDFMSSQGFDAVKAQNPDVLKLYNSKKGTGGTKAAFGDVQYMNEVIQKARWWTPAKAYAVGGVRVQSFSDYVPRMVFDYVQMIYDLAATKLPAHAYTKEALFVKQFGLTGIKINMSLIPAIADGGIAPGLDANGNYVWAGESFDFETAKEIQNAEGYTENCGTICVGVSDLHIRKLLNDPNIRQVIPYHKSGLNPIVAHMNRIAQFKDYTGSQNTLDQNGSKVEKDFDFNQVLHKMGENGDPKTVVDQYLEWCDSKGYTPKFSQFRDNPNYYKLIEDFTLYDANDQYVPQREVRAVFPTKDSAFGSMKDLINEGLQEDAIIEGKRDASLSSIVDEIQQTLPKTEAEIEEQEVEQADRDLEADTKFSVRESVEETKDLLAFHNITPKLLLDAIGRNNLLMPSLAVTNKGMTDFGEISLLFDKNTIDPKASEQNKLYGSDAWTPTQTQLKKNAKFDTDKTIKAVNTMKIRIGSKFAAELFNVTAKQFQAEIRKADGSIYDAYAHNIGMQTAYAMEKGIISKIPTKKSGAVDRTALQAQLNSELDADDGWRQYKRWLNNISDTIITSYDQATNEDILRNMKSQPATAKTFKLTETGELVVPAAEYASIDEARRNKNRLSETAAEATKAVADEFLVFANKLGNTKAVVNAINASFASRYSTADIVKTFGSHGIRISTETASELQALYKKAVELPTQYFEAKPQRAVGLNEVKAVVLPDSSGMAEVKAKLEEMGISVVEYTAGSNESRVEALNSMENLKFSFRGTNKDGIEVYETSEDIKKLPYTERQQRFLDIMENEYRGRTAKFIRNGHAYYATFEQSDVNKNIYGDNRSDKKGWKAKINVGAEGNIFELVENARYDGSKPEKGKKIAAHRGVGYWDYFVKNVQIDGTVFDLIANVRKKADGAFVYSIQLNENKKIKASPPRGSLLRASSGVPNASRTTVTQPAPKVNNKNSAPHSDRDSTYLDAVKRGDMETAQKMVDEAANKAGYTTKGYHGSPYDFTVVDGYLWLSRDELVARYYYGRGKTSNPTGNAPRDIHGVYPVRYRLGQNLLIDADSHSWADLPVAENEYAGVYVDEDTGEISTNAMVDWAAEHGYNSVTFVNVYDGGEFATTVDVVLNPHRDAKSADPVTYDDSGNVIPVSERFNTENKDIRYSDRDTESVSNRSLLANAFEGVAQNDIERNKIQEYKSKIDLVNSEEQKLRKLNEQIKELSFAKGPRDTAKIRELQFEAKQTANRIGVYDKQLLRLEASKPLQDVLNREKKMAYQRAEQKGKEALAAYREKAAKTQRELLDRYRDSRKKAVEGRERTAMRHKVQSVVGELNQLLLSNDKKRHVPDSLKKAVADALSLVNMDTVGAEERAAKYAALIAKETDPDKIDAYTVTMENILRQGEKMGQRLKELRDAYEEIQNSDDPDIANAYDPVIAGSIAELSQTIGNTSLKNMTVEQLQDVYDMYRMVLTRVRDANKSLIDSIKETIANRASRVVGEVRRVGGEHKVRASAFDPVRAFSWNNLKPIYAMERIGSSTMTEAYNNVRKGEDTWAQDVVAARAYYIDKSKKYGYDSWDFEKKYRFKSVSEQEFDLTLEQILSLYAYAKRDQAGDHLKLGGFVFDSNIETYKEKGSKLVKYKVNTADAHQISPEILAQITGTLTKEQTAFVDEMQDYLSTVMGAKGNEVTMKMYGVKLFKEKFYFPLKSARQFMFEQNEVAGEVRIKNSGFTNKTKPKANNPVILNNFMDVWANHVNDMSMYHAFVLPLEDFNRIFNYNSPKQEGKPPVSVKGTIQSAYSPAAVSYVKQLITDLNGGAMSDPRETFAKAMTAKFKKAKVFSSLSVVIQQPSAIGRAFAEISPKYFHPTKDGMNHDQLWAELKQYAPVAVIKEMGYFDTNMGRSTQDFIKAKEYTTFKEKAKGLFTDSGYRDEVLSRAPALADELAWCSIWNAVKRETVAKHHDLSPRSEKFLKIAGERFAEVVTKTQVYDSVLARSANMRSKSGLMSMATSFMAEPTTAINMVGDAVRKAKRGDKGYAAKAFASVAVSVILNNALVALVYGARDDDEDETYAEKYAQSFVSNMIDDVNPITYYPFLKDMWSLLQGYSVERSDMSLMSDLADATKALVQAYASEDGDVAEAWWNIAGAVANIGGIPMQNIRRDVNGAISFYNTLSQDVNGRATTLMSMGDALSSAVRDSLPLVGWLPGDTKTDKLYDAIVKGDTTYVNRLKSGYKTEDAYHNAVRKALRENDPRIKEAAQAQLNGDPSERVRIAKEIIADGFVQDDVVAAINTVISDMTPKSDSSGKKAKGFYTADDFAKEWANGDRTSANAAKADIIATAKKNGKTQEEAEESFVNSAKTALKELYLAGEISESRAVAALKEYCEVEEDDIYWTLDRWKYEDDTGSSDGYGKYNDFHTAVQTGKNLKAVIKEYTDNGVENKTLASQITSYFKPLYREMTGTERAALKGYLLNAYVLLGYDRYKKSKDIDKWLED